MLLETSQVAEVIATGLRHFSLICALRNNEIQPSFQPVDLYLMLSRLLPIKQARWPKMKLEIGGPSLVVMTDQLLLDYALGEMIDNSARVRARRISCQLSRQRDCWSLTIKDDGRGPQAEELSKLTQPYYCGVNSSRRFGLGLYVVDQIAQSLKLDLTIGLSYDKHLWLKLTGHTGESKYRASP